MIVTVIIILLALRWDSTRFGEILSATRSGSLLGVHCCVFNELIQFTAIQLDTTTLGTVIYFPALSVGYDQGHILTCRALHAPLS